MKSAIQVASAYNARTVRRVQFTVLYLPQAHSIGPRAQLNATLTAVLLQDVSIEGGPGALALLRDADTGCLRLTCLRLDLDLSLHFAIGVWTASVTHKPYALDPDFDL